MSHFSPVFAARPLARVGWLWARATVLFALVAWCALASLALPARAAETDAPPARVGQLSLVFGTGQMLVDPSAGWQPVELNTPVSAGSRWAADPVSRLELRIGSIALHLAAGARIQVPELNDSLVRVELVRGGLAFRVRALPAGERVIVSVPGARVQVLAPGVYRANHNLRERRFTVLVVEGQARVTLGAQDLMLGASQHAVLDMATQTVIEQGPQSERSPLDQFAQARERRSEQSVALNYVSAEMTGVESLDGHGSWRADPGLGALWFPNNLPPDWAPYRVGRWRWLPTWGWTWMDDAPWGFAPFHYGRWVFVGGRWGWAPGQGTAPQSAGRPAFAPALVGFYGSADTAAWTPAAQAPAVVGWYPLAPGEVYWPAYTQDLAYVRTLNATSVADASQIRALPDPAAPGPAHRFARTAFAATAVPQSAFLGMQPVPAHQVQMPPAALATAPLAGRRTPPRWALAARAAAPVLTLPDDPADSAATPPAAAPVEAAQGGQTLRDRLAARRAKAEAKREVRRDIKQQRSQGANGAKGANTGASP